MKQYLFPLMLLCSSLVSTSGQEYAISTAFDTSRIYVGDQISFMISVRQPESLNINIPAFKDTLIKNVEILNGPLKDTTRSTNGMLNITEKYLVTSFDSGLYEIKPLFVEINKSDSLYRYYSNYATLEVVKYTVAPADSTAAIYDIIGPYKAPITLSEIIPWILIVILAAGIVWGIIFFVKKKKSEKPQAEEIVIKELAHVIAFRELEQLKNDQLWQSGKLKQYYTRLTEILRLYLENRYKVFSLELTTSETLHALLKTGFRKDASYHRLDKVLTTADLVKFAKLVPGNEENELQFGEAWSFVEETKEIPAVNEDKDGKEAKL
ncbi:MAG TPA: hypothetical protein VHO50_05345 [Bacteroidales bacterium]|nr:hypothetical protein [Bacteroidales bacterium]